MDKINFTNISYVLENFYCEIDFSEKSFRVEKLLIKETTNCKLERDFLILTNVTKILLSISNEFKYFSTLLYENRYKDNVIISISSCEFTTQIPDTLINMYLKRKGYDEFITKDFLITSIKLITIHRIKFLTIVNKTSAEKTISKFNSEALENINEQVNYTKGNSIVIKISYYSKLSKLRYDKKLPILKKQPICLLEDKKITAFEFLNNETYSKNL